MTLPEILGYLAAILLIASFAVKPIVWLRRLAIAMSLVLIAHAAVGKHWPLLAIGLILAGINLWRLIEMRRLISATRAMSAASAAPVSTDWLLPYMRPIDVPKDHVIFRRGEIADAMYFLSAGRVRFEELDIDIGKGSLFGEIGIFSVDQIRTATAICLEPCSLLLISADRVRELYYQNPEFGFYLVGLITRRLIEDAGMGRRGKP